MTTASSILAADFGSVTTRALLIDVVAGEYQIVAHASGMTTTGYPFNDVSVGFARVVRDLEAMTGRTLLDGNDTIITPEDAMRRGVDLFVTTASAGRPMRAVMVGLMPNLSLTSGLRAIAGAYIEPVNTVHLRDERDNEGRLNAILLSRPDLIFISGGTERGAQGPLLVLLQLVQLALRLTDSEQRPQVIFAGNQQLAQTARDMLADYTPGLTITDNIRPDVNEEDFERVLNAVGAVYDQHRESHGAGFGKVGAMSDSGVLPTAQSYALIAQYFAEVRKGNIITVDIGSTSSIMAGSFKGQVTTRISTVTGVGTSAQNVLERCGEEVIQQWLPFYVQPGELVNYALNKSLRPAGVPMSLRELYLEHAFLRAALREMTVEASATWPGVTPDKPLNDVSLIIMGGASLTGTGSGALSMLLMADVLQPTGIVDVKTDTRGTVAISGALARFNADAVVQLLDDDGLEHVGTLISVDGMPQPGRVAVRLTIRTDDGSIIPTEDGSKEREIMSGQVLVLPIPRNFKLNLQMRLARGLSINGKRRVNVTLSGGTGGILLDARGRSLVIGATPEERAEQMPVWVQRTTDAPLRPIPPEWLIAPEKLAVHDEIDVDAMSAPVAEDALEGDDELDAFLAGVEASEDAAAPDAKKGKKGRQEVAEKDELDEELGSLRDIL